MKVRLIDIDRKERGEIIPNLALMKLSAFHKRRGDQVSFNIKDPDYTYISVLFKESRDQAAGIPKLFSTGIVHIGGPGWDLKNQLHPDIEMIKPDYELYPSKYSQDFTTCGCIRKCPWCVVPQKEGTIKIVKHPSVFHDDRFDTCMIMDNNLFGAGRDWTLQVLGWFRDQGIKMLEHGFDARLLTEEYAGILADIKCPRGFRFAWDTMKDEPAVMRAIGLLKDAGHNLKRNISFYVLVGFPGNTIFEQDLYRCNKLRELGVNSYVMRYSQSLKLNALARWANHRDVYWKTPFEKYTRKGPRNRSAKLK